MNNGKAFFLQVSKKDVGNIFLVFSEPASNILIFFIFDPIFVSSHSFSTPSPHNLHAASTYGLYYYVNT